MNEGNFEKVALRAQKYFFDNSIACFTVNSKLACGSNIEFAAVPLRSELLTKES
jgi:hypothetical protein